MKIFERIAIGYKKSSGRTLELEGFVAPIRVSKRAKKTITIMNEDGWNLKRNKQLGQQVFKNIFRTGFKIEKTENTVYSSSSLKYKWFLFHPEFGASFLITAENLSNLIQNCTIVDGEIQDELIWASNRLGFISQNFLNGLQSAEDDIKDTVKKIKEELKDKRVTRSNLVPGRIYQYVMKDARIAEILYLGTNGEKVVIYNITKYNKQNGYDMVTGFDTNFTPDSHFLKIIDYRNVPAHSPLKQIQLLGYFVAPVFKHYYTHVKKSLPMLFETDDTKNYCEEWDETDHLVVKLAIDNN